jgi:hypothetical protein
LDTRVPRRRRTFTRCRRRTTSEKA